MNRKLVAAVACRNQGSRLYGKPLQNLDVENGVRILDNLLDCLRTIDCIDEIVLGISEGVDNEIFREVAREKGLRFIMGDQIDVLSRLIQCGELAEATDVFRVTSESPFLYCDPVEELWRQHCNENADATFMDGLVDGCGFEFISLAALQKSHSEGETRHRSELCSLFIRENSSQFKIGWNEPPANLVRRDLRLTVDNPEDLALCRIVYGEFKEFAPRIPIDRIIGFLDLNPKLIELVAPFTETGYSTMYIRPED